MNKSYLELNCHCAVADIAKDVMARDEEQGNTDNGHGEIQLPDQIVYPELYTHINPEDQAA